MPYKPVSRATLLIPSGPPTNPDKLHLHVILTDECAAGFHLLGSIASVQRGRFHDKSCIIEAGEHEFIKHDSYFIYRRLTTARGSHIVKCVDGWLYRPKDPVSVALYNRICAGIDRSDFSPRGMQAYWAENKP